MCARVSSSGFVPESTTGWQKKGRFVPPSVSRYAHFEEAAVCFL